MDFMKNWMSCKKMVQMILDSLRIFVSVFAIFMGINLVHMIFYMDIVQRLRHCFIKKYGYTVYKIEKKNGDYIHCFCTAIWNGITYYIDVRGITNNYDEFISEFEDFVSKEESLQCTVPVENFKNDYPFAMELASKVESYFKEYYDFELFQKETELMRRLS